MDHPATTEVEGVWKSFEIRLVRPEEDTPKLLEHLRNNFYRDEALCSHLGFDEALAADSDAYVIASLKDGISLIAIHKPTNKIAGARISSVVKKGHDDDVDVELKSEKTKLILGYISFATKMSKIFENNPDIDRYVELFMASVGREFRGQGLLTEMYNRSLQLYRQRGFPLCKVFLTSPATRKACEKNGFTELCQLYLRDYINPDTGKSYFPSAKPDEVVVIAILRLDK